MRDLFYLRVIMPNYYYFKYKRSEVWYILLKTLLILLTIAPVLAIDILLLVLTPLEFLNRTLILVIAAATGFAYVLYLELALDFLILEFFQTLFIMIGSLCDTDPFYWYYFYGDLAHGDYGWKGTILEHGCGFFDYEF